MSVGVELDAYVLPDDHRIYKFFPGKGYKFFDQIVQSSVAFIDIRGLDKLKGKPNAWNLDEVLTAIATDRVDRSVALGGKRPSRLVRSKGDKAHLTFLKGLLFEARKGDFIIMPTKDYDANVRVGELLDDPGSVSEVTARDGGFSGKFFGRKVHWFDPVPRKRLDPALIRTLQTPATFFKIKPQLYEDIYRLALDNFFLDGQFVATFRTDKRLFTSKDNLLTSLWFELIEVVEEAREDGKELQVKNIYELAVNSDIDEDDRNDLSIFIQSPGWFKLRALIVSPFVAMALFSLASADVAYADAMSAHVSAKVVQDADASCLGKVDEAVREYLEILGKDRWEQACVLAVKAASKATLRTEASLNHSPRHGRRKK